MIGIGPLQQSCADYARGVAEGTIPACKLIRRAVDRFISDLEHAEARGLYFDEEAARRAIAFIECLRHSKGKWRGRRLVLAGWQRFIVANLFGWKYRATGFRRFKRAYIEIPRKNGKSTLVAAILLYLFFGDGEGAPEVYTAATSRKQAKIVFGECRRMVKAVPALRKRVAVLQNSMTIDRLDSILEPVHSKSENLDGLNAHGYGVDEYHEHRSSETYDKLRTSTGARDQALGIVITTAGKSIESVCYQERSEAIRVVEMIPGCEDEGFFVYIAAIDDDDDWTSEDTWARCNPNLGVSRSLQTMREEFASARNSSIKEADFKRYYLDKWTNEETRWIRLDDWRACPSAPIEEESLRGRECNVGVDLAATQDTTSVACHFPPADGQPEVVYVRYFIPADLIERNERRDRVKYSKWVRDGWMIQTPGNVTDTEAVRDEINRLAGVFKINSVGLDPWNTLTLGAQLVKDGEERDYKVEEVQQVMKYLSEPAKDFEKKILRHELHHGGNPVLTWQVSHTVVISDGKENIIPHKKKSKERIDGVAAIITAKRMSMDAEEPATAGIQ